MGERLQSEREQVRCQCTAMRGGVQEWADAQDLAGRRNFPSRQGLPAASIMCASLDANGQACRAFPRAPADARHCWVRVCVAATTPAESCTLKMPWRGSGGGVALLRTVYDTVRVPRP